jgi:hypothetical protein
MREETLINLDSKMEENSRQKTHFTFSAFKVKLEAATQMKSVSDQDKRPNCLIIDEIDGAPAPTVQVLN